MTATVSKAIVRAKPMRASIEFARYFLASALALAIDSSLYALVLRAGAPYQAAAAAGFVAGVATAYGLSVRWAFRQRSVINAQLEFAVFLGIGLCGLVLTEALLWLQIGMLGIGPMAAKLCAAATVFLFNFGARKLLLFTRPTRVPAASPCSKRRMAPTRSAAFIRFCAARERPHTHDPL